MQRSVLLEEVRKLWSRMRELEQKMRQHAEKLTEANLALRQEKDRAETLTLSYPL